MKKATQKITAGCVSAITLICGMSLPASAADYSEEDLKNLVSNASSYEMKDWIYEDFDGNGTKEGFAWFDNSEDQEFAAQPVDEELIYIDSDGNITNVMNGQSTYVFYRSDLYSVGGGRNVVTFHTAHHGTYDKVYGVKDNQPYEMTVPSEYTLSVAPVLEYEDGKFYFVSQSADLPENYGIEVEYDFETGEFVAVKSEQNNSEPTDDEAKLKALMSKSSNDTLEHWVYRDFDGDGSKEAFAAFMNDEYEFTEVRFINESGDITLLGNYGISFLQSGDDGYTVVEKSGKSFVGFDTGSGAGYSTYVFGVDGGKPYELDISGSIERFMQDESGRVYCYRSLVEFDESETVDLVYNEKTGQFSRLSYEYEQGEDGGIIITKYNGADEELIIPSEIDGKKVTEIGSDIFGYADGGNSTVKRITIPSTVKTIGDSAFACANVLEEVVIEDGVEKIGDAAFGGCIALKKITIPASVTEIGNYAFCYAYASDSTAAIDVTIYCYKDSAAHSYALGENPEANKFSYVLLDEDESSEATSSAEPSESSSQAQASKSDTSTANVSSGSSSKGAANTENPNTGTVTGICAGAFLAVLCGAAVVKFKGKKQ